MQHIHGPGYPKANPARLLADVEAALRRFVVFGSDAQVTACAVYVLHTYCVDHFEVTPYLAITSVEKQSGKSRLLEVLEALVCNPMTMVSPSAAVLYRTISAVAPTVVLDEVDTIFSQNYFEDIRAVLNAGFRRGAKVPRWNAESNNFELYDTFCPKVLAGIGQLPDTVQDRSISIRLKRRVAAEQVDRFRRRQADELEPLRNCLREWGELLTPESLPLEPPLPEELTDRQQDAWEPLLVITDLVGGDWPRRAREAAVELSNARLDGEESLGTRLLTDLRELFRELGDRHLTSEEVIRRLNQLNDAPWKGLRDGHGISPFVLNKLLRGYGIRTTDVRVDGRSLKGLRAHDLHDAFERYLPAEATQDAAISRQTRTAVEYPPLVPRLPF